MYLPIVPILALQNSLNAMNIASKNNPEMVLLGYLIGFGIVLLVILSIWLKQKV